MIPEHGRERAGLDEAEEEEVPAATRGRLKAMLLPGVAAVLLLAALGMAVFAIVQGRATQARLDQVSTELKAANESLTATRNELESLKFIVTRQKAQLDAERKQEESPPAATRAAPHPQEKQADAKAETKVETKAVTQPASPKPPEKPAAKPADKKVSDQPQTKAPDKSNAKQLQGIREAIEKFNQQ